MFLIEFYDWKVIYSMYTHSYSKWNDALVYVKHTNLSR